MLDVWQNLGTMQTMKSTRNWERRQHKTVKLQMYVSPTVRDLIAAEKARLTNLTGRTYSVGAIIEELVRVHLGGASRRRRNSNSRGKSNSQLGEDLPDVI